MQGLAYSSQTPEDASFVQLIYTARLRKYKHEVEHALTRQKLVEDYGLGDNPDVLYSFADALYAKFRWADCHLITQRCITTQQSSGCAELIHSHIMQNPGASCDPQRHDATTYRMYVPPLAPALQTLHPRSRDGGS